METECITQHCIDQATSDNCLDELCIYSDCTPGPDIVIETGSGCTDGPDVVIGTAGVCTTAVYGVKPGCTIGPYITITTCGATVKPQLDTGNQIIDYPPAPKPCNSKSYWCEGEHKSALLYCDNCIADKGSTVAVNGEIGTTAALAICGNCSDGQLMEFTDFVSIKIQLTSARVGDAIVFFGHDLCESGAQIEVLLDDAPVDLESHTSNTVIIDSMCTHCAGDTQCETIAIYPPALTKATSLTLNITAAGVHHLDRLFWGQCCEICLEVGASDPWVASRYEHNDKNSGCVVFPRTIKPKMNQGEFSFENKSESWMRYTMRSIIDYGERYPMWLAISKNRRPNDVGLIMLGDVEPAVWSSQCKQSITVPYQISTHSGLPCYDFDQPELLAKIPSADDDLFQ